ncbi:MAG: bifunctional diaminohydroxyphosphoribosylaminopyrimidine deaminase/5-amino-6-(5-phosphoribosylamino)uracil reductase RibD [Desulfobacterales bacterium]|jgi:diaminohydroxyphosphoribosylaminopyrimidine deaminase/5-amino-6-(5-phosphoribosylamino)uracil reductase
MEDEKYMLLALDLAQKGAGFTSPNPMVGAVVVKDNRIVGKGYHAAAGQPHAEVNAIEDAGLEARGGTLYVSLEPCNHTGRTPPCTEKILAAGIRRVVVAMRDPNPDVQGGGLAFLSEKGIEVTSGVCEDSAERLNEVFIKYARTRRPFVTIKCAATLDGRIATRTGDARWVSGAVSRKQVHRLRHASDAIMVGVNTVRSDDPSLTTRINGFHGKDPRRFILDTHLSISEDARVLQGGAATGTTVVTGPVIPEEKLRRIEEMGVRILSSPLKEGRIDLNRLMAAIGAAEVTSLLVEGGSRVIASAFRDGIVDKVIFFFAPKILGGDDGVPICRGPGPGLMQDCLPIKKMQVHRVGEDVMIEGYV